MIERKIYLKQVLPFIDQDIIKVITGMRRSGKSVFLQLIQNELKRRGIEENQFISLNLEALANEPLTEYHQLHKYLLDRTKEINGTSYIFLDEIQKVPNWQKAINSLRVTTNCDIYLTGSNSQLLSGELATLIAGRYIEIKIYPFSFDEFLTAIDSPRTNLNSDFMNYVNIGGLPFLSRIYQDKIACQNYLTDIYNSVVLNDIVSRYSIRNVDLLQRIFGYLSSEIGHPITASKIQKYLKSENRMPSLDTILDYINYSTEAFLFQKVPRQELRGKKSLKLNEKFYIMDHGLRNIILGNNQRDIDQVLENIVYIELKRRGYNVEIGINKNQEIDFVATKGNEKKYYQVTYLLANESTITREFGAYNGVQDFYPKYVLSMDNFDFSRNGIIHQNIIDFLLETSK